MLFSRRLGFSGTPSDLLPRELGACHFAPGDDARILDTLTQPDVVELRELPETWSVDGLLSLLATASPPYQADAWPCLCITFV
jgi:hypothetical protein